MKKKSEKSKDLEALRKQLEKQPNFFVASYEKITVQQDFELRKTIRGAGGTYQVVKNNLAAKASEGLASESLLRELKGMTSLAFTHADPVTLAKALIAYGKTTPAFTFKAGFVEGRAVEVKSIQDLANLPSRDEILSKLLYLIQAPAQRLVTAIGGVGRNVAVVIDQGVKESKFPE